MFIKCILRRAGQGPAFGTRFGPNLNSVLVSVHGSVLTLVSLDHGYAFMKRDKYINVY